MEDGKASGTASIQVFDKYNLINVSSAASDNVLGATSSRRSIPMPVN